MMKEQWSCSMVRDSMPDRPDGGRWQIGAEALNCLHSSAEGFVEEVFADSLVYARHANRRRSGAPMFGWRCEPGLTQLRGCPACRMPCTVRRPRTGRTFLVLVWGQRPGLFCLHHLSLSLQNAVSFVQ